MPIKLKTLVYRSIVRPVALYSSECRPATNQADHMLRVEINMLRWSLDVTRFDRIDISSLRCSFACSINHQVAEERLRWFGHMFRSDPSSVAHTAYNLQITGTKTRGRPKLRQMDNVKRDMCLASLSEADALDRPKWRKSISNADPVPAGFFTRG